MTCLTLRVVSGSSDWMDRSTSKASQATTMIMVATRNPGEPARTVCSKATGDGLVSSWSVSSSVSSFATSEKR